MLANRIETGEIQWHERGDCGERNEAALFLFVCGRNVSDNTVAATASLAFQSNVHVRMPACQKSESIEVRHERVRTDAIHLLTPLAFDQFNSVLSLARAPLECRFLVFSFCSV